LTSSPWVGTQTASSPPSTALPQPTVEFRNPDRGTASLVGRMPGRSRRHPPNQRGDLLPPGTSKGWRGPGQGKQSQSFPFTNALSPGTSDARVKEKAPGGSNELEPSSLINLFPSGTGNDKILAPDHPQGCLLVWECGLAWNLHALHGSLASEVYGVRTAKPRNTSSLSAVEVSSY